MNRVRVRHRMSDARNGGPPEWRAVPACDIALVIEETVTEWTLYPLCPSLLAPAWGRAFSRVCLFVCSYFCPRFQRKTAYIRPAQWRPYKWCEGRFKHFYFHSIHIQMGHLTHIEHFRSCLRLSFQLFFVTGGLL